MDLDDFKAPYIRQNEIWQKADDFCKKYWKSDNIPVDILSIIEFELKMEILPINNLITDNDTDALLLGDLKTIVVDNDEFLNDKYENRIRFSLAHEIGHLILHNNIFSKINHNSIDEWIQFYLNIPDEQYKWIEMHAYEFAGRLLVPKDKLIEKFNDVKGHAEIEGFKKWDLSGESVIEYLSHEIAKRFGVSEIVIEKRLIKENIWPIK